MYHLAAVHSATVSQTEGQTDRQHRANS